MLLILLLCIFIGENAFFSLCKCSFSLSPYIRTIPRYLNTEYCEHSQHTQRRTHSIRPRLRVFKRPNVYTWHTKCILFLPLYRRLCQARAREIQRYTECSCLGAIYFSFCHVLVFFWLKQYEVIVRCTEYTQSALNIVTSKPKHSQRIICIAVIKCLFYYYFRSLYLWVLTKMCNVQFAVCTVCITWLQQYAYTHQHKYDAHHATSSVWKKEEKKFATTCSATHININISVNAMEIWECSKNAFGDSGTSGTSTHSHRSHRNPLRCLIDTLPFDQGDEIIAKIL